MQPKTLSEAERLNNEAFRLWARLYELNNQAADAYLTAPCIHDPVLSARLTRVRAVHHRAGERSLRRLAKLRQVQEWHDALEAIAD